MESTLTTMWRSIFGLLGIVIIAKVLRANLVIDWRKHGIILVGTSALMVGHWITYFYSLDYSNVAVALTALYTFPAITAILDPLMKRRRIPLIDLGLAIITFAAIIYIAPPLGASQQLGLAILLGLASALCFALRNIWIATISNSYPSITIMVYQLVFSTMLLLPLYFTGSSKASASQWVALVALGLITTAAGHTLFVRGITRYQPTTASIFMCLTPIYGILLAFFFLHEVPSYRVLVGGVIILGVVVFKALQTD